MLRKIDLREIFLEAIKVGADSQSALGHKAGLNSAQMSNWKTGKRDMTLANFQKLLSNMDERSWRTFLNLLAARDTSEYTEIDCIDQLQIFAERLSVLRKEREKREKREDNRLKESVV
jgi:transcriptional regulator with XRE-family HTH domain